jgi:hypothetical protein
MEWQLRDYRIAPGRLDEFVAAWHAGVVPLRRRHGFRVLAWSIPKESRFVWMLGYAGPQTFEEADDAYYEAPERVALTPDPAQWVVERLHVMVNAITTEE